MTSNILFIGYGNPGRLDDGLGPACADALTARKLEGVTVDADYQLTVEDAAAAAAHAVVIFADAAVNGPEPFAFRPVRPVMAGGFSTHSVEPEAVMGMAHTLFGATTRGFALAIRGYAFNAFGEELSPRARVNLDAATRFIEQVIRDNRFADFERVTEQRLR